MIVKNNEFVPKLMAYPKGVKEVDKIILSDPKALYFVSALFASMNLKSCAIGSVSLRSEKVIIIIENVLGIET